MKLVVLLGSILLLSACGSMQSQVVKKNVAFDPGSQAQIRSYGSYGSDLIRIYPETDCAKWEGTKRNAVNRRFVNGLPRKVRNISIGIPPTELSRKTEKDTGFVFRDSYREMVVSADQPVVLDGAFSSQTRNHHYSCRVAASFTPKAGEAYEVRYLSEEEGCDIEVYHIGHEEKDGVRQTKKLTANYCARPGTSF